VSSTHAPPLLPFLVFPFLAPQTSIQVKFPAPLAGPHDYSLQWKAHGQGDYAPHQAVTVAAGAVTAEAVDLEPGTTYCIRLCRNYPSSTTLLFGPELIVDTEQVGCTPKTKSSPCCVVS
jgi:hypothetical protein